MKFPVRIIVGVLLFCLFFLTLIIPSTFAQEKTSTNDVANYILPQTDPNVPQNLHTFTQSVFLEVISTLTCQLGGVDFSTRNHQCLSYNPSTDKIGYAKSNGGLLGVVSNGIAMLYTPPFRTRDYINYLADNFGLAKHAYAAGGSGFDQLTPLAKLWVAFRNVVYLLFVVIFVLMGFAIMIRAKIDPRTVMTIENQIPKIVIALLLVTFSFAIAGLLIDIMWLLIYVTVNLFASIDPGIHVVDVVNSLPSNPLAVADKIGNGGILGIAMQSAASIYDILQKIFTAAFNINPILHGIISALSFNFLILFGCLIGNITSFGAFTDCMNNGAATELAFIGSSIAFLIFLIAILSALIKLFLALLRAYILFLVYVVLGPFFIMLGVFPGSKVNFEDWLRHLLAYLFVFPTTVGIFLLGRVLSDSLGNGQAGFVPPLIGSDNAASSTLGPLIGFAIIMLAPSALAMVQEAMKAPDFKFLPQIGQGVAAGGSIVTGGFNRAVWDPLFRERNIATGAQEGLVRGWFTGGINSQNTPAPIRALGRWFGLRREADKGYGSS